MKQWKLRSYRLSATKKTSQQELDVACRDVVEIVTDYLEGVLDAATASAVEAHLQLCDGCEEYIAQMRTTIGLLGRVPLNTLSTEAKTDLMGAFRDFNASPRP